MTDEEKEKERLAVLESKVEDLRADFGEIKSTLKEMNETLGSNRNMLARYITYNKVLWPIVTVCVSLVGVVVTILVHP